MKHTFLIAFLFLMFLPGLALSEPITTQEFTVKANCAQPREGIELAFDQNPETIWHTPWGEPGKYPFQVEVTFRKPEVVEKIWYLPRQKGVNGILRRYKLFVKKGTDDKWVRVRSSVLSPTPDAQYITMEPTMCTALRLDILEGIAGFASAAEFVIFRPDTAFSELSNVSEKLAKGKWVKVPVFRRPSAVVERQRRGGGFDWSDLQPTGLAVKEGAKFTVWLDADLKGPLPLMGLCKSEKQASITLAPGENVLEAPFDGILYVKNPFDATEQKTLPKIYISGAKPIPLFRLGKTDEEEWRKMLEGKNPVGLAELSSKRILMTFSVENVKKYVDSPAKILKEYEYLMAVYAKLMGFDEETDSPDAKPTVHTRPRCRMRLIEVDHGHMFATFGYTAYHFGAVEP
ncbi:MAG: M60 family metallopeptidase, partial [Thermoguttaceae bacterium]|nr:M60 family metallopeptidase [Thermoguttaceae bacterium]